MDISCQFPPPVENQRKFCQAKILGSCGSLPGTGQALSWDQLCLHILRLLNCFSITLVPHILLPWFHPSQPWISSSQSWLCNLSANLDITDLSALNQSPSNSLNLVWQVSLDTLNVLCWTCFTVHLTHAMWPQHKGIHDQSWEIFHKVHTKSSSSPLFAA